jgi:ribosomal protein S18 acetylase RimI-like enzyme
MTDHPLDNPLWSALGGSLAQYCIDFGGVRLLDPEIGTVAAMMRITSANLSVLASAIPIGAELLVIAPEPVQSTAELDIVHVKPLFQMVAGHLLPVLNTVVTSELSAADFAQMLDLVDLTRPGPLGPRAMELGRFRGIFAGMKLVALAGERLHLQGYTEISTVCTHPDYRGRHYGMAVVSAVAQRIAEDGQTPFLGVNADNLPAIHLYERLGFAHRTTLYLNMVKRR